MNLKDILRVSCGRHVGYTPTFVSEAGYEMNDLKMYRQLKRIPRKISAYFYRDKIKKVFKSNCFKDPIDEYYLLLSTDNTIFQIEY